MHQVRPADVDQLRMIHDASPTEIGHRRAAAEDAFCRAWIDERAFAYVLRVFALAVVVHAGSLLLVPIIAAPEVKGALFGIHAGMLAALIAAWLLRKRRMWFMAAWSGVIVFSAAGYTGVLWYCAEHLRTHRDILLSSAGVLTYGTFAVNFAPIRGLRLWALAAALAAGAYFAMRGAEAGPIWAAICGAATFFNASMRQIQDIRAASEARREFRFRSQVAPAHVVRHAPMNGDDFAYAFRPELKFCVCVSSDWRNYQELSASVSASQLTMSLSEYYNMCEAILHRMLPHGNYYSDWIADELFLVLFPVEGVSREMLVESAVAFGEALIAGRTDFARVHGVPRAIDVGISAGEALIGIMGPDGHRKVTSLGQVPGRSRRLQSAGKLLRQRLRAADRVIIGPECRDALSKRELQRYDLAAGESVRDADDREIYYLEPLEVPRRAA